MSDIPVAICRECGKFIFNCKGTVNKKGEWTCNECEKKHDK
jgi:hypothetical protein